MRIPCFTVQITLIVGLIHLISANHQHQVTFSESEDGETSYGYKSSPTSSISYEDDDSYGAEESSNGHRVITGSGRMTILDKRVDSSPSELHETQQQHHQHQHQLQPQPQPQETTSNVDSNDQHSIPPVMNNLQVEWTEHIDHGPSKVSPSSKSSSSSSPSYYAQNVPRYPINYSSNDNSQLPTSSYSSPSSSTSDNLGNNKFNGAKGPSIGYANVGVVGGGGHQGHYNEPYVGYSESRRIDSEWEFPLE